MTWALSHWKPLSVALGLAVAFAAGRLTYTPPPAPAVHAVEDTASQRAVAARKDELDKKGPEKITTIRYEKGCGKSEVASETVIERGPEVVETHASEQTHETAQTHTDLTITPPPEKLGWAVGAGVSLNDKALRLELDRRLFGNLWLGASVVPLRREVGLGLRMEF